MKGEGRKRRRRKCSAKERRERVVTLQRAIRQIKGKKSNEAT